jgi:hypothetical protein
MSESDLGHDRIGVGCRIFARSQVKAQSSLLSHPLATESSRYPCFLFSSSFLFLVTSRARLVQPLGRLVGCMSSALVSAM